MSSPPAPPSAPPHLFRPLVVPPAESFKIAAQFGHDTEAGRMLARLYGAGKPAVSAAPRASRTNPLVGAQPPMQGLNARASAADPRAAKFDRAAVAAHDSAKPSPVVAHAPVVHRIDTIKGIIRSKAQVEAFEAAHAPVDVAMPPVKRGYDGDAEKRRLQATFQFKGGKGAPDAASYAPIEGPIPMHLLTGTRAPRRGGVGAAHSSSSAASPLLKELEATFDAVQRGFTESVSFIAELRSLGACTARHESEHAAELQKRTRELERLQARIGKQRAKEAEAGRRDGGGRMAGRGGGVGR